MISCREQGQLILPCSKLLSQLFTCSPDKTIDPPITRVQSLTFPGWNYLHKMWRGGPISTCLLQFQEYQYTACPLGHSPSLSISFSTSVYVSSISPSSSSSYGKKGEIELSCSRTGEIKYRRTCETKWLVDHRTPAPCLFRGNGSDVWHSQLRTMNSDLQSAPCAH